MIWLKLTVGRYKLPRLKRRRNGRTVVGLPLSIKIMYTRYFRKRRREIYDTYILTIIKESDMKI